MDYINNLQRTIIFTTEAKSNGSNPFLFVLVIRRLSVLVQVYRKPKYMGRYLHYKSNNPAHVKRGVLKREESYKVWFTEPI
jgi:hypothetical protein